MTAGPDQGGSREVGRYRLVTELAKGPLGPLAVAVVAGTQAAELVLVRTLARAKTLAATDVDELAEAAWWSLELCHPNIMRSKDVVVTERELATVSDHEEGEVLRTLLGYASFEGRPAPGGIALRITLDALEALAYIEDEAGGLAEGSDLAHGGLLPDSVLVGIDGRTRVLDVGVGAVAYRITSMAHHPELAAYMAPEFIRGGSVDGRTVVFSVGVLLWELLTGRRLFAGPTYEKVVERVLSGNVQSLDNLRPAGGETVPQAASDIVARALRRDPAERFGDTRAMAKTVRSASRDLMATHQQVASYVLDLAGKALRGRRATVERTTGVKFPSWADSTGSESSRGKTEDDASAAREMQRPSTKTRDRRTARGGTAPLPPKPVAPPAMVEPKPKPDSSEDPADFDEATRKRSLQEFDELTRRVSGKVIAVPIALKAPAVPPTPSAGAHKGKTDAFADDSDVDSVPPISIGPEDSGEEEPTAFMPQASRGRENGPPGGHQDELDSEPPPITVPPDSGEEATQLILSSTQLLGEPAPWEQPLPGVPKQARAPATGPGAAAAEPRLAETGPRRPPSPRRRSVADAASPSAELTSATTQPRTRAKPRSGRPRWLPIVGLTVLGAVTLGAAVALVSWLLSSPVGPRKTVAEPSPALKERTGPARARPKAKDPDVSPEAPTLVPEEPRLTDAAVPEIGPKANSATQPPPAPKVPQAPPRTWIQKPPKKEPPDKFVPSGI